MKSRDQNLSCKYGRILENRGDKGERSLLTECIEYIYSMSGRRSCNGRILPALLCRPSDESIDMKQTTRIAATVSLILLVLAAGCSKQSTEDVTRKAFDALADDAVSLYVRMHPLRASRLGLAGADSLLFTFSPGETEHAMIVIDSLIAALSALPADDLDDHRIDESILLSDWMKGEQFAFKQSRTCLDDPLLYCWMIEEALMGIPFRPWPPTEGERQAWAARISQLPALVENASTLLKKPGGTSLEEAARRLRILSDRLPRIARIVEQRYGGPVTELGPAGEAVRRYREIVDDLRAVGTSGRLIMGMEELSKILKYSEHLDFDPAKMIVEAEKITRRLSRQIAPGDATVAWPGEEHVELSVELADSILGGIEEKLSSRRSFGRKKRPRSPVAGYEKRWIPLRLPVNPYLTLPVIPEREITCLFDPVGRNACVPTVYIPTGRDLTTDRLFYELLLTSSLMSSPDRKICGDRSRVRMIFGVETYRYAWKAHNSGDLTGLFPERRMQLSRIQTTERVTKLARMILVFRLHTGKYTTEDARDYLREVTTLDETQIAREMLHAMVSPVSAFEGIAIMTAESMVKRATIDRSGGKPRERVRKLLLEAAGMPPYLLMERMPS